MSLDDPSTPPTPAPPRNGAGSTALVFGVVAFVFAFVPVIGEFVALPAAIAAMVLGWIGFERAEDGEATNSSQAIAGGVLGLIAGLVVLLVFMVGLG